MAAYTLSVVTVALVVAYASALDDDMSLPPLPSSISKLNVYPTDSSAYNEYKKEVYKMNQAYGNMCFNAQAASDYYQFYMNNPLYQTKFNEALNKFEEGQAYLVSEHENYVKALDNFRASMAYQVPPTIPLSDDVPVSSSLL